MTIDTQELKIKLQRAVTESDADLLRQADDKLTQILQTTFDGNEAEVNVIRAFMQEGSVQKRKLLSYCSKFVDPTVRVDSTVQGEQICQHAFLKKNELHMLYQFVTRHQSDVTFGDAVYKVMDAHGMTAPQVYKNALLRRQDFARVTDPRCKNVTRRMAWQIIVGLHCSLDEADDVLFSAGYIRSNTRMDLIMQHFIESKNYDIEAIDAVLTDWGLKTFACE